MLLEESRQFFDGEIAVFVFVDFEEDLTQEHDFLLGELGGDVVENEHFEFGELGVISYLLKIYVQFLLQVLHRHPGMDSNLFQRDPLLLRHQDSQDEVHNFRTQTLFLQNWHKDTLYREDSAFLP